MGVVVSSVVGVGVVVHGGRVSEALAGSPSRDLRTRTKSCQRWDAVVESEM